MSTNVLANEDAGIYKDILLQSLTQAIEDKSLDMEILPALQDFNAITGVVTVDSCAGHDHDIRGAFVEMHLSYFNWVNLKQVEIERLLKEANLARVEFYHCATEEGMQRSLRLVTHPGIMGKHCVPVFKRAAKILKELHDRERDEMLNLGLAASKLSQSMFQSKTT